MSERLIDESSVLEEDDRPSWASPQHFQGIEDGRQLHSRKTSIECTSVQISIDGTRIVQTKTSNHTVYLISVCPGFKTWIIERRYSDFIYLNQQIQQHNPSLKLPPLPKKTIFQSSTSHRVVEERKEILQYYLDTIARIPAVWSRSEFVRFLDNESNSMMFVWNFERMQKMQMTLSTMTIDNTSKTAKLTTELREAQDQVALLQERIARMEMLFLQNAIGVSTVKLPPMVINALSSAVPDTEIPSKPAKKSSSGKTIDGDSRVTGEFNLSEVSTSSDVEAIAAIVNSLDEEEQSKQEAEEADEANFDAGRLAEVISEHVASGQPLPPSQVVQALNMAYGRQSSFKGLTDIRGQSAPQPVQTTAPQFLIDPTFAASSKRALSAQERQELKMYAISRQLEHALRMSDEVLSAADAQFQALAGRSAASHGGEYLESIEDTVRDIQIDDRVEAPLNTLEILNSPAKGGPESAADLSPALQFLMLDRSAVEGKPESGVKATWISEFISRTDEVIAVLLPTAEAVDARHRIFHYVRGMINSTLGVQLFPVGSLVSNTFLPGGDVDVTSFLVHPEDESWFVKVNEALCMSSFGNNAANAAAPTGTAAAATRATPNSERRVSVRNVSFVNAEVKVVRCEINNISVDISANQLSSLYAQAFIVKLDDFTGQSHLLKRSILLIKAWCALESPRFSGGTGSVFGAKDGRLSTWAIVVMVVWIFNMDGRNIHHPMQAFGRFLSYYSCFDWNKLAVTVHGIVSAADLSPLSETHEEIRRDPQLRNLIRQGTFFPAELLNYYKDRYATAKAAACSDSADPNSFKTPSPEESVDSKATLSWGARTAFSVSDFYRRGLVNILNPVVPSSTVTRAVDVAGLLTIRRVFTDGFRAFEQLCEECKSATAFVGEISASWAPEVPVKTNLPTIVKEFWQNTSVVRDQPGHYHTTGRKSDALTLPPGVSFDPLASQITELEISLQHAELVLASVVNQSALIRIVMQIIAQRGPLPVGEIGKHLHTMTGSDVVSKRMKEMFGGLKKAIESANCTSIQIMSDHQFNPTIRLITNPKSSIRFDSNHLITAFEHNSFVPQTLGNQQAGGSQKGSGSRKHRDADAQYGRYPQPPVQPGRGYVVDAAGRRQPDGSVAHHHVPQQPYTGAGAGATGGRGNRGSAGRSSGTGAALAAAQTQFQYTTVDGTYMPVGDGYQREVFDGSAGSTGTYTNYYNYPGQGFVSMPNMQQPVVMSSGGYVDVAMQMQYQSQQQMLMQQQQLLLQQHQQLHQQHQALNPGHAEDGSSQVDGSSGY